MKKIIVIGCPGSGKSTFARSLAEKLGISLYHLDAIWHRPDKTHITREEFDTRLAEIMTTDTWIIDGNYSRTVERRISACDTVFLFDLPTEVCLDGAIARLGKERDDIPWTEATLDPRLKQDIEEFSTKNLPTIYSLLEKYSDKNIIIFKTREAANIYLSL